MSYVLKRTSMALDPGTLEFMTELAKRWSISKAEVMRRAIKHYKEEADRGAILPGALGALAWLQNGGGLSVHEAEDFRREMRAERQAKVFW
jgi:predicted DNA-binding protein